MKTKQKRGAKPKPLNEKVTQLPIYLKLGDIKAYGADKLRIELTQCAKTLIENNRK